VTICTSLITKTIVMVHKY